MPCGGWTRSDKMDDGQVENTNLACYLDVDDDGDDKRPIIKGDARYETA